MPSTRFAYPQVISRRHIPRFRSSRTFLGRVRFPAGSTEEVLAKAHKSWPVFFFSSILPVGRTAEPVGEHGTLIDQCAGRAAG